MFLAAQAGAASSQRWLFVCGVLHRLAGESRRKRFKSPSFWERSTKADEDVLQTLLLLEARRCPARRMARTISQDSPEIGNSAFGLIENAYPRNTVRRPRHDHIEA